MPTDMADLAASIGRMAKQQNPEAYGEWDDAELGAQLLIQQQGQVHALFRGSNEMDPAGKAVVRKDEPPPLPLSVQRILSGEPPLAASHPAAGAQEPDYGYGFRYNSRDPKGLGYLGTLKRPDRTGVMGEYSIGDEQGREIPSMVPTLTRKEVEQILALPEGASPSEAIKRKARVFAQQRRDAGLPVFARAGEQNTALYRDIPRDAPEARPQPPPMMPSHQTQQELNPPSPPSPWSKAQTIGAPGLGDRYVPPTTNEIMASDNPFRALLESVSSRVIGPGRPRSVAAADPYGLEAALEGKGHFPVFMGTVDEVGGAGRGLFSRVDDAVSRLPAKGAHPNKIAGILKSNASAEELAYRQVPEFLAAKGNATVTPAELAAHLEAHPAPMPAVKTLAASGLPEGHLQRFMSQTNEPHPNTPTGWVDLSERLGRRAQQWQRNGDAEQANRFFTMSEEAISMAEGLDHGSTAGQPKYAQYQLPGGNQYRETLLTLPDRGGVSADEIRAMGPGPITADQINAQAARGSTAVPEFRSGHFNEPNILVHTRSNMRTLPTGERGRFLEEVQSDWHQTGKEKGYQQPIPATSNMTWNEYARAKGIDPAKASEVFGDVTDPRFNEWFNSHQEAVDIANRNERAVPDAPFKESWPDLGVKQQLLEAAQDPETQWIGFTSGQTQAARYALSQQVRSIQWAPAEAAAAGRHVTLDLPVGLARMDLAPDGTIIKTWGKALADWQGKSIADVIGKPVAEKIFDRSTGQLEGEGLNIGGEGMKHFYDQLMPKRLEKIVKKFGGTVERTAIPAGAEGGSEQAWIARLTPEMKARILKEGLPLMTIGGIAAASQLGPDSDAK